MACKVNARKLLSKLGEACLPFNWRVWSELQL